MKALITHCTSAVRASKLCPIAGRATFSTEPSMKARLEARMQVARIEAGMARLAAALARHAGAVAGGGEGEAQAVGLRRAEARIGAVAVGALVLVPEQKHGERDDAGHRQRHAGEHGHGIDWRLGERIADFDDHLPEQEAEQGQADQQPPAAPAGVVEPPDHQGDERAEDAGR